MRHPRPIMNRDGITLYQGDCARILPKLSTTVDAILTDPPYNVGCKYRTYNDDKLEHDYTRWLRDIFTAAAQHLRPGGALVWFWRALRLAQGDVPKVLPQGLLIHHVAGWFKRTYDGDRFMTGHPAYAWQPIIWAFKDGGKPGFYAPRGGPVARDMIPSNSIHYEMIGAHHPCPQPEQVVKIVLQWVTPPGGTVLDPFAGSGTTLRAALDLGRKAIGIELDRYYCKLAIDRLAQHPLNMQHQDGTVSQAQHTTERDPP